MATGAGCNSSGENLFDVSSLAAPLVATAAGVTAFKIADDRDMSEDSKMGVTALAAGAGYVVADAVRQKVKADYSNEYLKGYDLGASDETKRCYWWIQDLQRTDPQAAFRAEIRNYRFPGPETRGGMTLVPHSVTIRIEE
jgi:hypothetical protein